MVLPTSCTVRSMRSPNSTPIEDDRRPTAKRTMKDGSFRVPDPQFPQPCSSLCGVVVVVFPTRRNGRVECAQGGAGTNDQPVLSTCG